MRRTSFLVLGGLAILIAASTLVFGQSGSPAPSTSPGAPPQAPTADMQVQRGRYLVALGDCVACHTQQGGARFAGGRPVQTPFGTLLSANITPDRDTGIGGWTADQFWRALHEGIDDEGHHLYPAFPYNYYTGITRADADAMFAYLRTLQPVQHRFERNKLPFPYNQRWLLTFWNGLFLHKGPMQADASQSAQWNRGAYLVQALGHCEACHTAKDFLGGPKSGERFRGGIFGTWFAPDITSNRHTGIGGWTDDELREFLRKGFNTHSAAAGEMGEMVAFSSSQMTDQDLDAVVTYLRSLPASPETRVAAPDAAVMRQGEAIWKDSCSACHRMDGSGVPRFFPPLARNANLQQRDATTVLHYILAGTRRVPNDRAPTPLSMPAYDWKLDDQQVAAVATFVRNSWGNSAPAVPPDAVHKLRAQLHFDHRLPAQNPPRPADVAHPGPGTLAPADTDSRDNGTAQAGRAAPANDRLQTSPGQSGSGGTGGQGAAGGGQPSQGKGGHPAGATTGGPG